MVSKFGKEFDRVVSWLKQYARFRVRTVADLQWDGTHCFAEVLDRKDGGWTVRIGRRQDYDAAVDCLLHEVAHIVDWERNGYVDGHDAQHRRSWGVIHSDLYRAYHRAVEKGEL